MSSKFLTYWSLTFAILWIWIFSVAVALADVKDELMEKIHKQWTARIRARMRPVDPLAGRSAGETITPRALDEKESWVLHLVSQIAIALKLGVRILVLQDSMGHYLVHFVKGKQLTSYRVDKAWVADAMAGKAHQRERIYKAVEQYLRQEFLGQPIPAQTAAPAPVPSGTAPPKPAAGAPAQGGAELSREEKIAQAKAKAEALKAQRAAQAPAGGTSSGGTPGGSPSG
jgi:hypothetical protein